MRQARLGASPDDPPGRDARLSGRVVGRLAPAEQFVLWALRQRLTDGGAPSPAFVRGFRLAFGLAAMEAGLAAFEGLFRALSRHPRADIGLCPLRCACVSTDEDTVLRLVTAAQMGSSRWLEAVACRLVLPEAEAELRRHAMTFAFALRRADLELPPRPDLVPPGRALLH